MVAKVERERERGTKEEYGINRYKLLYIKVDKQQGFTV